MKLLCSELTLDKGPGGPKRDHKGPKGSQDWVPLFHHANNNLEETTVP